MALLPFAAPAEPGVDNGVQPRTFSETSSTVPAQSAAALSRLGAELTIHAGSDAGIDDAQGLPLILLSAFVTLLHRYNPIEQHIAVNATLACCRPVAAVNGLGGLAKAVTVTAQKPVNGHVGPFHKLLNGYAQQPTDASILKAHAMENGHVTVQLAVNGFSHDTSLLQDANGEGWPEPRKEAWQGGEVEDLPIRVSFEPTASQRPSSALPSAENGWHAGEEGAAPFASVVLQVATQLLAGLSRQSTPSSARDEEEDCADMDAWATGARALFDFTDLECQPGVTSKGGLDGREFVLRSMLKKDGCLELTWLFSRQAYAAASIRRLAANFHFLLESLASLPAARVAATPVHRLDVLCAEERQLVKVEFSGQKVARALHQKLTTGRLHGWLQAQDPKGDMEQRRQGTNFPVQAKGDVDDNLVELFDRAVRTWPDRVAVLQHGASITYRELHERAQGIASFLIATLGIPSEEVRYRQEDMVAIGMDRCIDWVACMLGTMMSGRAYLPLDPAHPQLRSQELLEQTKLRIVLSNRESAGTFQWAHGWEGVHLVSIETLQGHVIDEAAIAAANPAGSSVCYVLFTSGSTGAPKGVLVTHRGVVNMAHSFRELLPPLENDVRGQLSASTFDLHAMDCYCAFDVGAAVAICPKEDLLTDANAFIRKFSVTGVVLTPTVMTLLEPDMAPSLRWLATGGEVLPRALCRKWTSAGRTVIDHYAPTECAIAACSAVWRPHQPVEDNLGRPWPGAHFYVLGPHLELLPVEVPGEMCIAGVHVSRGYLNRPDLTAKNFQKNPFSTGPHDRVLYRTGDRCRWLADGRINFLGRIDFQVKVRGHRIEPAEIEDVASRVEGVVRCVGVLRPGGEDGRPPYLALYLKIRLGGPTSRDIVTRAVRDAIRQRLPSYMMPAAFVILDELPYTASGKVDRKFLPEPPPESFHFEVAGGNRGAAEGGAGGDDGNAWAAQQLLQQPEERAVAAVFAAVLPSGGGVADVLGPASNFFDLGGNSFTASQAIARLPQALVDQESALQGGAAAAERSSAPVLTIREFFENPTVSGLADALRQRRVATDAAAAAEPDAKGAKEEAAKVEDKDLKGHNTCKSFLHGGRQLVARPPGDSPPRRARLSEAQLMIYLVKRVVPRPELLDSSDVWRLRGRVDVTRLEHAFQLLLKRHQALRLRFAVESKGLKARVLRMALKTWGNNGASPVESAVEASTAGPAPSCCGSLAAALAGAAGPLFLRHLDSVFDCVSQVDQLDAPFRLHQTDLSLHASAGDKVAALSTAIDAALKPFDMNARRGLLFRATLICGLSNDDGEQQHVLVITASHLICDGISAAIMYRELPYLYRTGSLEGLPPVPAYNDYVAWEVADLAGSRRDAELKFWRATIGRVPETLRLSPRQNRSVALPWRGAWLKFVIPPSSRWQLEGLARQQGATLNMALLALFNSTLHLWSRQSRILVGTLVSRRPIAPLQGVVGHLADVRPVLTEVAQMDTTARAAAPGLDYLDMLAQVKEGMLAAIEHQRTTFRLIATHLSKPDLSRDAIISAYFNFLQPGTDAAPWRLHFNDELKGEYDMDVSWLREGETSLSAVSLLMRPEQDGSVVGRMVYQADILERSFMTAMCRHYSSLLESAVAGDRLTLDKQVLASTRQAPYPLSGASRLDTSGGKKWFWSRPTASPNGRSTFQQR
eukprot:SM000001S04630  [mRNA]  locus=s1:1356200:1362678:- [translate_table: standard]